jgi:hypothetical protein
LREWFCAVQHGGEEGRNFTVETPMLAFLIGLAALVAANLATDHQLQREGFDELRGGIRLGT